MTRILDKHRSFCRLFLMIKSTFFFSSGSEITGNHLTPIRKYDFAYPSSKRAAKDKTTKQHINVVFTCQG